MKRTETVIEKMAADDFVRFVCPIGGLIGWMKTNKNEVLLLTGGEEHGGDIRGIDVKHLLRDLVWAQQVVVEEDFFRFKLFIKSMREGEKASVIFRVRDREGQRCWLKMQGAAAAANNIGAKPYYGYIRDITEDAALINHLLEKDSARQTMIETDVHPVLLVDMETKAIISRNTHAYQLFGYTYHEFNRMKFSDFYPLDQESKVAKIYEICLSEGFWNGKFILVKKGNISIEARIKIKRLTLRDRNLLRVSIDEILEKGANGPDKPEAPLPDREAFERTLTAAMAGKDQMPDILDTLLEHQYGGPYFDAVMYADVYIKKGRVDVYGRGHAFKTPAPGMTYDYEGTISQLIGEKHLDYVILEDTLESTRPIEWALFIPHGIRSYFAKPFFHSGKLRTLLIFCADEPNRFSEADLGLYEVYYPAFLKGLRDWRKGKRKKVLNE